MECNGNGIRLTVSPICSCDGKTRLREALSQIRRNVDFDAHLFGELGCAVGVLGLRVAAGDEDATVVQ